LEAAIMCAEVWLWHFCDITRRAHHVCFRGRSGRAANIGRGPAALPAIADAIVGGFERSPTAITILIFGKGGNDEIDAIYENVAPVFRAFPAQAGSCIVRYYDKAKRKIESDLVT